MFVHFVQLFVLLKAAFAANVRSQCLVPAPGSVLCPALVCFYFALYFALRFFLGESLSWLAAYIIEAADTEKGDIANYKERQSNQPF